jgi:hypothetical protein
MNEKSKYGSHGQSCNKQKHSAECKEGPGKVSIQMKEKKQPENHGIRSRASWKGSFDARAFPEELLDAGNPVVFADDGPNDSCEKQKIEITVLINPRIWVAC